MNSPISRRGALCLFLLLAAIPPSDAEAVLPPAAVDYVIVTSAELAPSFAPLASFKSGIGIRTRVVTLEWIADQDVAGADQAATLRGFLCEAHAQWGTRYALLGGAIDVVPTRWIHSSFYPANGGSEVPADLYFACLDGTWDGDGDGVYCEPAVTGGELGDAADFGPELAIGRAPVRTAAEAAVFTAKSIAFHAVETSATPERALLAADVLIPFEWTPSTGYIVQDGATLAEMVKSRLAAQIPPWQVTRLYENHSNWSGALPLTGPGLVAAMSAGGHRLVHHASTSYGTVLDAGPDHVTNEQLAMIANPEPFFLSLMYGEGAALDRPSPVTTLMLLPGGGCSAGLGLSRAEFPNTAANYYAAFFRHVLAVPGTFVGDALVATFGDYTNLTSANYTDRWMQLTMILLGDPTAPLVPTDLAVSNEGDDDDDGDAPDTPPALFPEFRLAAAPNPFNPRLDVVADLPDADRGRLSICDVRGREVRLLFDGSLSAGEARWQWDGCDESGRGVASGVYVVRLVTSRRVLSRSVTLAR